MKECTKQSCVILVDNDVRIQAASKRLFESVGLQVKLYPTVTAFLEDGVPDITTCLVLDLGLHESTNIREELAEAGVHAPIVFITSHEDVSMAVRTMKAGAVDFLVKPYRDQYLLDAVFTALERDSARVETQQLRERFQLLSGRERQVIERLAAGDSNKIISAKLNLSEVTVKFHRANAMRKLRAKTLVELVRMVEHLDVTR